MKKLCYCANDKNRKPLVISIGGGRDNVSQAKEIEIVVCPHSQDEQPCECGGKSPNDIANTTLDESGPYKTAVDSLRDNPQKNMSSDSIVDHNEPEDFDTTDDGEYTDAKKSRSNLRTQLSFGAPHKYLSSKPPDDDGDEDFTKLPLVAPRYHGPGCVLEVSVLERHDDSCGYKKLPNDKRNPMDDRSGSYDCVGRMVFKTCNPEVDEGEATQVEVAQIIPMLNITEGLIRPDKRIKKEHGETKFRITSDNKDKERRKQIEDFKNTLKQHESLKELAGSQKTFPNMTNVSIQTPILVSREVSTDEDGESAISDLGISTKLAMDNVQVSSRIPGEKYKKIDTSEIKKKFIEAKMIPEDIKICKRVNVEKCQKNTFHKIMSRVKGKSNVKLAECQNTQTDTKAKIKLYNGQVLRRF